MELRKDVDKLYVWGPVASQSDRAILDEEYPRYGDMKTRNMITRYFNSCLEKFCDNNDMSFLTLFYDLVDENMNTIDKYYMKDFVHLERGRCKYICSKSV